MTLGCLWTPLARCYYPVDEVTIDKVEQLDSNEIQIVYRTLVDAMYYSPGVDVVRREENLYVYFARTSIYAKRQAAFPAKSYQIIDGRDMQQSVSLPIGACTAVYAAEGSSTRLIWKRGNRERAQKLGAQKQQ